MLESSCFTEKIIIIFVAHQPVKYLSYTLTFSSKREKTEGSNKITRFIDIASHFFGVFPVK